MKKIAKPLVLGFSLLAFAGASALAQQGTPAPGQSQKTQSQKQAQAPQKDELRTSDFIGSKVSDNQGKEIGEIEDVVVDLGAGRVRAVVLSFGGVLGMGEKHYAFPMSELHPGKKRGEYTMNVNKQKLENAEGFAKDEWPALDDEYWGRAGRSGGAAAGATRQGQNAQLARASKLDGQDVEDRNGKNIGEIKDVVISMDGQVRNIVLDLDDGGDVNIKPGALSRQGEDRLVLNMDPQQLKSQSKQRSGASTR